MSVSSWGVFLGTHNSTVVIMTLEERTRELQVEMIPAERINRKKFSGGFPLASIKYILSEYADNLHLERVGGNCYYSTYEEMETRLLTPVLKNLMNSTRLNKFLRGHNKNFRDYSHHLCHAFSYLFQFPFRESLIVVADGVGNKKSEHPSIGAIMEVLPSCSDTEPRESFSVYHQKGDHVECIYKEYEVTYSKNYKGKIVATGASLGNIYAAGAYVVFGSWLMSGKLMGLSIYGKPDLAICEKYKLEPLKFLEEYIWQKEFSWLDKGSFDQLPECDFQARANFAATIQHYHTQRIIGMIKAVSDKKPEVKNIALAGGCALNCLTNHDIFDQLSFKEAYVSSTPDDTGIALGAAFLNLFEANPKVIVKNPFEIRGNFGPLRNNHAGEYRPRPRIGFEVSSLSTKNFAEAVVEKIKENRCALISFGRSESGPRALGFRSILANPFSANIVDHLNNKVKFREQFRPYGLILLQSEVSEYFEVPTSYSSPFMSFAPKARKKYYKLLSEVMTPNSRIRIQTVSIAVPHLFDVLLAAKKELGHAILINTSLNTMGQPICETEDDFFKAMSDMSVVYGFIGYNAVVKK